MAPEDDREEHERRRRLVTLVVASLSSAVAAIVVRQLWGPGTLIGAAVTPVIVTLLSDSLRRPAEKVVVVGVPAPRVRGRAPGAEPGRRRDGPARASGSVAATRRARPSTLAALALGLAAFVLGAGLLTGSELLFGERSAATGAKRTTVFGGSSQPTADKPETETSPAPTQPGAGTGQTTTETTTQTVPAPTAPTGTTPATPPATTPPPADAPPPTGATP